MKSSADHDFRMEKAWWPVMYRGWSVNVDKEFDLLILPSRRHGYVEAAENILLNDDGIIL